MKKNLLTRAASIVMAFSLAVIGLAGCGSSEDGGDGAGAENNAANNNTAANNTAANNDNGGGTDDNKSTEEKLVVNVAGMTALTFEWTSKIAHLKNFYEEEFASDNIEINYIDVGLGPAVNEAFLAGELDIAIFGDFPILTGSANGTDVTVLSSASITQEGIGLAVAADSDITDISQLKGKKIALGLGTTTHQQILRYLETAGLTADDVELINSTGVDVYTLLLSGEVDAVGTGDPSQTVQTNEGTIRIIASGNDENKAQNSLYVAASKSFLKEHGDVAARFLKALNRAYEWYNESDENKQEAYGILADYSGTEASQIPLWIDHFDASLHLTDSDKESIRLTYEFLQDNDLIAGEVDLDELFDDTWLKQALE